MFKSLYRTVSKFLGNSLTSSGLWSWATPGAWGKTDLIKQYQRVMFSVISAIAEDAAKITFIVYKDMEPDDTPIPRHDFVQAMKRPNPDQSQFQFLELHFTYLKLVGESYWYVVKNKLTGKPQEFYLLRPDIMQVVVDKANNPLGLVTGYVLSKPDGKKIPFEKDEVLHFKMANPSNPYYGMGVIEAAKTYIQTEEFASDWTKMALYNSGRPSGIVSIKGTIDETVFNNIKARFKDEYSGTANAGKTLFLKGTDGIDYQKMGMELGELALKELKDMTRDDIMMMFRVSKTMLGISEDVSLNNARESRAFFKESITIAEWDRLTDHLTAFLLPFYDGVKAEAEYVAYEVPDLESGEQKINEWTAGHNKWLTTNDIRRERGLDPLPGGDVIRESIGLVPTLDNKPREPRPLPGQNPNDNKPNDQKPNDKKPTDGKPPKDGEKPTDQKPNADNKPAPKKQISQKEFTEKKEVFEELLFQLQESWVPVYKEAMVIEFNKQETEILEKHGKKSFDWLFDVEVAQSRLMGVLTPMGLQLMVEAAKLAFDIADDVDTEFLLNEVIKEYIRDRIERLAIDTNAQTVKALEDSLNEGIKQGENQAKLRNRVSDVYDQATKVRAELIARTEAIAASNEGTLEAYRQSPLVTGKEWSANFGACEFCMSLNGKVVEIEKNFADKGTTLTVGEKTITVGYEHLSHPPLHPNCRCALLPVIL